MRTAFKFLAIGGCSVAAAVVAAMPWRLGGLARRTEIATSMARATGLDVRLTGPITIKLLPLPRVRIGGVSIAANDGALLLDAPVLNGDLDLGSLLRGHWSLSSATISEPVISADIDREPTQASLVAVNRNGFKLQLRSGVLRLRSRASIADTLVTDLNVTAQQGNAAEGSLSLSGSAVWHGSFAQFAVRLADPRAMVDGGTSPAFAQVTSSLGGATLVGDLTGGRQPQFAGRVSASTGALPRALAALGMDATWLGVQKATLSGEAVAKLGDVSVSNTELRLDDMIFEGTVGYHGDGTRSLIEGTLATALLDIGKLGADKLDAATAALLYRAPWSVGPALPNLDLRVSANRARVGPLDVHDAALSALFRDGRLELTVDEASAFSGTVKVRAVATLAQKDLDAHADMTLSGIQLGALSDALFGEQRLDGELTGKLALDGRGQSLSDVVHRLGGDGQLTVERGTFTGVSISQALKRLTRRLPPVANSGQITTFEKASAAMHVEGGVVNFLDGQVVGPGISLSFGGKSDLPQGKVSIAAVAAQTDAAGNPLANGPRLPFEMRAAWGEPLMLIERQHGLSLPLPSFDPGLR